ncbi:MAG TPA: LuxR C-terminal-related transcriptional regulator [Nocardioides sp.]|nr:LuxR C-terminal-related transcriptional regulator [Nocardioides sp.]
MPPVAPAPIAPAAPAPAPTSLAPRREVRLTPREVDVLTLLALGRSNAEIAGELFVSVCTVKSHVRRLLAKLNRRDRLQLVVFAYTSGFMGERQASRCECRAAHPSNGLRALA